MSLDNVLFYGGIAAIIVAVILGIVCFFVLKMKKQNLDAKYEREYGPVYEELYDTQRNARKGRSRKK